jgi:diguanylate cyclase (GGDEF)-like protein
LFGKYAAISLVPVVALGAVLAVTYRGEARRRGRAEARSEALLVARTAVEPILDGRPLDAGLTDAETNALQRLVTRSVGGNSVLRLRLRDLDGRVIFSDDGSGAESVADDEAIDAAHGEDVVSLTHLNADSNDSGPTGTAAVEVYLPLAAGSPATRVGVLEMYLPYAPIGHDVSSGLGALYRNLAAGLAVLYLALLVITVSVTRGLRRLVATNRFMAEHDALTELPNRMLFQQRAEAATSKTGVHTAAIAIIDLDRFKEINDSLGHHNGDRLLAELSSRLREHMRPGDTVARLGGDEFGVILRDVSDADVALRRLRQVVDREIELSGLPISVEASIGYALAPDDGTDTNELLQRADVAMYAAKAEHAGVLRYHASQDRYDAANLGLSSELRHAIDAGELRLHYQPKACVDSGSVHAVEALVRWQHPKHGLLMPNRFLPLAERTDIIDPLTNWVVEAALRDIRDIEHEPPLSVAVNVSARNLSDDDFADHVLDTLARVGMAPERLIVEITETALLADPARAAATLRRLSDAGIQVSIDDFGRGQTSLGYLAELPVHELKIDMSFVQGMLDNSAHCAIVQSIIDLGHNLSLQVVGEGVETGATLEALEAAGCDVVQGYLLAKPMPSAALREWLATVREPVGGARAR